MKKVFTLYSNYPLSTEEEIELQKYFEEDAVDFDGTFEEWKAFMDELSISDMRDDLNRISTNTVVAIADIGRWNGRFMGYKTYKHLSDVFYTECDSCKWYVDRYDLRFSGSHHDGTNHIQYREIKDENKLDKFLELIYSRELTPKQITYYTRSVRPHFKKIYGL